MLQKQHACIMQLIRIADSQVEEYLAKFINAYVRPDSSNLVAINRDLLELWHSKKIFYAQLKKMEHLVEESPCKKDQAITLCGTFCMINFCPYHIQHIQALLPIDLQQRITFVHGFFIDAIKIHNFCAIFCLLMRHPSPGMGSITFTTYTFGEMKILILS